MDLRFGSKTRVCLRLLHASGMVLSGILGLSLIGCSARETELESGAAISSNEQERPILAQNSPGCPGGAKAAGGVSFIYRDTALGKSESGKRIIVPGAPKQYELIRRVTTEVLEERMPPAGHGEALGSGEIAILETWIREGANWEEHWSYVAPAEPEVPQSQSVAVAFLGDNPVREQWAKCKPPLEDIPNGIFTAPHGMCYDSEGNLFVQDWSEAGRITRLDRVC